jgi:hypothetical protein
MELSIIALVTAAVTFIVVVTSTVVYAKKSINMQNDYNSKIMNLSSDVNTVTSENKSYNKMQDSSISSTSTGLHNVENTYEKISDLNKSINTNSLTTGELISGTFQGTTGKFSSSFGSPIINSEQLTVQNITMNGSKGPWIEQNTGGLRSGLISQNNNTKLYAPVQANSSVSLGFASSDGSYTDALTVGANYNAAFKGGLTVSESSIFNGPVSFNSPSLFNLPSTFNSPSTFSESASFGGKTSFSGPTSFNSVSPVSFGSPATFSESASFAGPTNVSGAASFTGPSTFGAPTGFSGSATFSESASFAGPATFGAPTGFSGSATFSESASFDGTSSFAGPASFTGPTNFNSKSPVNFNSSTNFLNPASFSDINISGKETIQGTVNASGGLDLANKWRLTDTGDDWLRINASGKTGINDFSGGLAAANLFARDNSYLNGKTNLSGPVKVAHNQGGWLDNTVLSAYKANDNATIGASFGGPDWYSHFPYLDGNTYVRPGRANGNVNIGDIGTGVLTLGSPQGTIQANKGINIGGTDPGALIEKNYGANQNKYGVGQFATGAMRVYSPQVSGSATVNLSLVNTNGSYDDIIKVQTNRTTNITGPLNVANDTQINGSLKICDNSGNNCRLI